MPSRRELLAALGATGIAAAAGCLGGPSVDPGTDESYAWPTGGADRRNSRAIPDGVAPREDPTVDWRVDLESAAAAADPVVTDGTVLATTGTDVVAFDRASGDRRWSIDPDNEAHTYRGAPTVYKELAYLSEVNTVVARDLESGEIEWSEAFEATIGRGSLLVTDDGDNGRVFTAGGNALHALDAGTGERLWEQELLGTPEYSLAKYTDYVYVVTDGGELYAVDEWGTVQWRRTVEAGIRSGPAVRSLDHGGSEWGIAVVGGDGTVVYFGPDGARRWEAELGGFGDDGIAIAHGTVLARSGSRVFALDPADGNVRWRLDLGESASNPPIIVGDTVYVGGDRLRATDIDGGIGVRSYRARHLRFEYEPTGAVGFVTAADSKLFVTTNVRGTGADTAELIVLS
ncbi:PQQ-binding-like beta-propeller repeat protein [Natrinema pallidum]|uniref:Pyrrolo-quinoline quinone n=1 Tax=Natrinema pallidum TaxID=69527 RepID=A0A4P9TE12_9EURY|nr:PQQ-binding-like beta-propeller repeat protein [Natrinema pallidum]QCW03018.1 pyrrolo-quinoline quinone [Natrinema pallidum]